MIKFLVIMPSDIRILFQYFNSRNLSATVLSKMFFTAYFYLLNISFIICLSEIALIANTICLNVSDVK